MLGLLDPQAGTVSVGGVDLQQLGKRAWRDMVGSVMQDDTLFAGSIADNISFYDEAATLERVETAARLAQLHDDIAAMPMAYHTLVGDMGSTLSGGQKQRLFLARAIYKQPRVLVLDEATSHLDVPCENRINASLASLHATRIFVAHRVQSIQAADRVLVCAEGGIHEAEWNTTSWTSGRFAQPMASPLSDSPTM